MRTAIYLLLVIGLVACSEKNETSNSSDNIKSQATEEKTTSLIEEALKEINFPFEELNNKSQKVQKLVSECLTIHKLTVVETVKVEDYIYLSRPSPFDKNLKFAIKLTNAKKNRFNENYSEEFACQWFGDEYKIERVKTAEELAKEFGVNFKSN